MRRVLSASVQCAAVFLFCGTARAQSLSNDLAAEDPAALAKVAREKGNAVNGAILFHQTSLNCAKCHAAGKDRFGPDLATTVGEEATDVYLVESILQPSKAIKEGFKSIIVITNAGKMITGRVVEQTQQQLVLDDPSENGRRIVLAKRDLEFVKPSPKSIMPERLADQLSNRQQFLDIVRYVMEIIAGGSELPGKLETRNHRGGTTVALSDDLFGLVLLGELSCLACHTDESQTPIIHTKQAPDLSDVGKRVNPDYIERFIADPSHVKPGTTMPDLMATRGIEARRHAARSITHYLISLRSQPFLIQAIDRGVAESGRKLFHSVGCVACHSPRNADGSEKFSVDSVLGECVPLGRLENKYNVSGLLAFLEDPLSVRPSGRMPNLPLSHWEARDIAHYLLQKESGSASNRLNETGPAASVRPFLLDSTLVAEGRSQFSQLGCVLCHKTTDDLEKSRYLPLNRLRQDRGCLSGKPGSWPRYQLSDSQQQAIRAALARKLTRLTDEQRILVDLTTFKCVACHRRGELGGVSPQRTEYFLSEDDNLGEQGRIPPPLTGVGAKLQPKWLRDVLVNGKTARPYLKTRMPQYGKANVVPLVSLFERVDQLPAVSLPPVTDEKTMRQVGVGIAGSAGMNCVACHVFKQKRPETMPAVDLVEMAERLNKDWFYHYMRNPQRFSPNTVMPSFWPGGRSIRQDILDGDTNQQIAALWLYLLDGRQAKTPRGVVHEPLELVVAGEAVMLRRNYRDIGKRGIGVGYPNHVNLAFDAEQMRLAMIWKGKFVDAGAAWYGQGSGTVRPVGTDLIKLPTGPELDDGMHPWHPSQVPLADEMQTTNEDRPPHHQFKGYFLDTKRRPTFLYRFENIEVEDYLVDVNDPDSDTAFIRRRLTFTTDAARQNTVFRVANDSDIVAEGNGIFLIGKMLRVCVDKQHQARIVAAASGKELRETLGTTPAIAAKTNRQTPDEPSAVTGKLLVVPINMTKRKSTLVLEYRW